MSDNPISKEPAKLNSNGSGGGLTSSAGGLHRSIYGSAPIGPLMLFVLIISVYALIVVGLTTDVVLLKEEAIILPFIQVGVPVVAFYVVTPPLIALLHINLLGRLILLARDIYIRGDREVQVNNNARSDDKPLKVDGLVGAALTVLLPIDIEHLMSAMRKAQPKAAFLLVATFLTQVALPLLVLLVLQWRFLAYQDEAITLSHQLLITIDLYYQFVFIRSLYNLLMGKKKPSFVPVLVIPVINIMCVIGVILVNLIFLALPLIFVWAVALIPDSSIEKAIKFDLQQSIAGCFFPDWWKKYEGDLFSCDFFEGERFIYAPNTSIYLRDPPPEIVGAIIHTTDDLTPNIPCEHVGVLDLSERRLLYANFSNSTFKCVEMKGAQLNGSILARADLGTANLMNANLSGADLSRANLSVANLSGAVLSRADLSGADLSGADLTRTKLHGADLSRAELYGATLYEAQLDGIKLKGAKLFGANFSESTPRVTSLGEVDGEKPEGWGDILDDIKFRLHAAGYSERDVDARLAVIKLSAASTLGYVLPTGTDHCVLYDEEPELNLPPECVKAERLE